jgi:hypothetical protein
MLLLLQLLVSAEAKCAVMKAQVRQVLALPLAYACFTEVYAGDA